MDILRSRHQADGDQTMTARPCFTIWLVKPVIQLVQVETK
jgi:hypothetical protein